MADQEQEHAAVECDDGSVVVLREQSLASLGWNGSD